MTVAVGCAGRIGAQKVSKAKAQPEAESCKGGKPTFSSESREKRNSSGIPEHPAAQQPSVEIAPLSGGPDQKQPAQKRTLTSVTPEQPSCQIEQQITPRDQQRVAQILLTLLPQRCLPCLFLLAKEKQCLLGGRGSVLVYACIGKLVQ